jgi:tripeptide aminopeptidase
MKTKTRPVRRSARSPAQAEVAGPPEPDLKAAVKLALELMAIPGTSGQEGKAVNAIVGELRRAGAKAGDILIDDVYKRTPLKGEAGNIIFTLPGTIKAPRRLLMAHTDTVPLCVGSRPVVRGEFVHSSDPATGLGADDRAGCAVVLTAAIEILRRKLPHPPVTFFWPVQEEVGLYGAHHVKLGLLGKPKLAFNWDGGPANKVTIGATGAYRLTISIGGIASHAGGAPEHGVSAITIASLAVADLHQNGWLGDVRKDGRHGTSNVGVIQGGAATNVITDRLTVRAECRSHDPEFRKEILSAFEHAFARAAESVKNVGGRHGQATIESRLDYESFRLPDDEPCVTAACRAVQGAGGEPQIAITNGGLDANWLSARGIPTVTLGCGQVQVHTVNEQLDLNEFRRACRVGLRLATGVE